MWVRELLNDRKWHHKDLDSLEVLVRHRSVQTDTRVVFGADILDICANGLQVRADAVALDDDAEDGSIFLPYHRVLRVSGPTGVLWVRVDGDAG